MRKVETKNKAKGLFSFFATLALALGVGVSLAQKETIKTEAAPGGTVYSMNLGAQGSAFGTSNSYGEKTGTMSGVQWKISLGSAQSTSSLWIGSNSKQKSNLVLSGNSYNYVRSAISGASASSTYYSAMVAQSSFANVGKVTITPDETGGSSASSIKFYLVSSSSLTTNYEQVSLTKGIQGSNLVGGTATTYEFNKIPTAFYALVFYSTNDYTVKAPVISFIEGAESRTISSIAVTTQPSKKDYFVGDTFDKAGMVVTAYYDDESNAVIPNSEVTVNPSTMSLGVTSVQVAYQGQTATVSDISVQPVPTVTSLVVTGNANKTQYFGGDTFDPTGLVVTAHLSNSTSLDVTSLATYGPSPLTVGTTQVTISYGGISETYGPIGVKLQAIKTVVINLTKLGLTGVTSSSLRTHTIDEVGFTSYARSQQTAVLFDKGSGYIFNTTNLVNITLIKLNYATGGGADAVQYFNFGSSAIAGSKSGGTTINGSKGGESSTVTPTGTYGFFNLSVSSSKALQLDSLEITYSAETVELEDISLNKSLINMTKDETTTLGVSFTPEDATNKKVNWSSSDPSKVSITGTGPEVTLNALGFTGSTPVTITATSEEGGFVATATVTVSPIYVSSVTLNKKVVELYEGKTETLTATVLPANATNKNVVWSSQNESVVTVNNGVLTTVGAGSTTVTVTTVDGSKADVANVTVLANPITSFIVNHAAVKKTYALGEGFDGFAGLVVKEKRASGEETVVTDYSISTIDTMELGKHVVRVEKGSFHDEFTITVTNEGAKVGTVEKLAKDLFFSEYIEGSGNNKALEIYNGTGKAVDLSNYQISQYKDGKSTTNQVLQLSGTLNDGDVYVIAPNDANSQIKAAADLTIPHSENSVIHFNGNDAVVLKKNYTDIDVIGFIGDNFTWGVGTGATAEYTLVRKTSVYEGFIPTLDYADSLENEDEWMVYAQDTTTYLGSHVFAGGTVVGDVTYEEQALAFARFVSRAAPAGTEGKGLRKSLLGPATQVAPTWEEVQEEKGAMDPESLVVFETSTDPEIAAGREVYGELLEENESAFADAAAFHAYIMGLTSEGDVSTEACATNFGLAKEEWNKLSEEAREVFLEASNTGYAEGRSRLLHWTFVNGWEFNGVVLQEQALGGRSTLNKDSVNFNIVATVLIGVIGLTTLAGYYFLRKKKHA